jgi:hypothetical protein
MAGDLTVLDHVQQHLVDRGLFRKPAVQAEGLHPLYKEPRLGTPAPGQQKEVESDVVAVVGMQEDTEIAVGSYESWYYKPCVLFIYRVAAARDSDEISRAIRGELEDRRAWMTTSGLQVIESGLWRPKQRLGSDKSSFTFNESFWLQLYSGRAPRG